MRSNPEQSKESLFSQTSCCDTIAAQILQGLRQEGDASEDGVRTLEEVKAATQPPRLEKKSS